jgi:hypothetical protein
MMHGMPIFGGWSRICHQRTVRQNILLESYLPPDIADAEVGVYNACYKTGLFMNFVRTAYTLGVEPFFF